MEDVCRQVAAILDECPLIVPEGVVPLDMAKGVGRYRKSTGVKYFVTVEEVRARRRQIEAAEAKVAALKTLTKVHRVLSTATRLSDEQAQPSQVLEILRQGHELAADLPESFRVLMAEHFATLEAKILQQLRADGDAWTTFDTPSLDDSFRSTVAFRSKFYEKQSASILHDLRARLSSKTRWQAAVSTAELAYATAHQSFDSKTELLHSPHVLPTMRVTQAAHYTVHLLYKLLDKVFAAGGPPEQSASPDTAPESPEAASNPDSAKDCISLETEHLVTTITCGYHLVPALLPLHEKAASTPLVALLQHTDCLFCAVHCDTTATLLEAAPRAGESESKLFGKAAAALRATRDELLLACEAALRGFLATASGELQSEFAAVAFVFEKKAAGGRFSAVEAACSKVMLLMKTVNKHMRAALPMPTFKHALGDLASMVQHWCCDVVTALDDITQDETERLIMNLSYFQLFESWFIDASDIDLTTTAEDESRKAANIYLPSRHRLEAVLNVLAADKMVDIMGLFNDDKLEALTSDELAALIRALYAPSALRAKNIKEIQRVRDGSV
ncbi:Centromere/kinetochore protein zw10-like protein [Diplonema papillatum]|nr:Centromere/kinetochore protein zw10-like protein [Diplonema papillatum]